MMVNEDVLVASNDISEFTLDNDWEMSINLEGEASNISDDEAIELFSKISTCSINELESRILSILCPYFDDFIHKNFMKIENILKVSEPSKNIKMLDDNFQIISKVLDRWNSILEHVKSQGKLKASTIKSILIFLPNVVIKIFSHYKMKRCDYQTSRQLVVDIFRRTCALTRLFCTILNQPIDFSAGNDQKILKELLIKFKEIGYFIQSDLNTIGQTCKTLGIITIFSKDIITTTDDIYIVLMDNIKVLEDSIKKIYENILKSSVDIFEIRGKCILFLLKILDRLYKTFCLNRDLSDELIRHRVDFIVSLATSQVICMGTKLDNSQRDLDKIRREIFSINWSKILSESFIKSTKFQRDLLKKFEYLMEINDAKYALGYQYLLLSLSNEWGNFPGKFLDIVISNFNYIQDEALMETIEILGFSEKYNEANIFDTTLLKIFEFLNEKEENFFLCETIILKNLLSESYWPAMLCYFILQYCYSITNHQLLVLHIEKFINVYEALGARKNNSFALIMIGRLIIEIYGVLSENEKRKIDDKCENRNSLMLLLEETKYERKCIKIVNLSKTIGAEPTNCFPLVLADLKRQPSIRNWDRLKNLLIILGIQKDKKSRLLTEQISNIWICIENTLTCFREGLERDIVICMLTVLLNCSYVEEDSTYFNWKLATTLFSGVSKTSSLPSKCLIEICHYISSNIQCLNFPDKSGETSGVPELFCFLLEDKSKWVHQEALETFDNILEHCTNEILIREMSCAINRRPNIRGIVPVYLQGKKTSTLSPEFPSSSDYLNALSKRSVGFSSKHQCHKKYEHESEEKIAKLSVNNSEEGIDALCLELMKFSRQKNSLNRNSIKKISNACQLFLNVEEY